MGRHDFLPSGSTNLDTVVGRLREMLHEDGPLAGAELRAVDVKDHTGAKSNYTSALWLVAHQTLSTVRPAKHQIGQLTLRSQEVERDVLTDPARLWRLMSQQSNALSPDDGSQIGRQCSVYRHTGRQRWGTLPCWTVSAWRSMHGIGSTPDGPFLLPDDLGFHIFLWDAAGAWIRDRDPQRSELGEARVIIPDTRAYFRDIVVDEQALDIHLQTIGALNLFVVATGRDVYGRDFTVTSLAGGESVRLPIPSISESLRIYLTDGAGTTFDLHVEDHFGAVPGESLFHPSTQERVERRVGLDAALRSGEDVRTEYKAWVPPNEKDRKLPETLESVVAFANTEGGAIFIGVDDHGELVGTTKELIRTYGEEFRTDVQRMRTKYVEDLRKVIATKIVPRVMPEFDWVEASGAWILRVQIPAGSGAAHYMESNPACFERRGSTDRRMSPPEILRLDAKRGPRLFRS